MSLISNCINIIIKNMTKWNYIETCDNQKVKNEISSFNSLRFFLAILIILYHVSIQLRGSYFKTTALAVECFFVLSGFFLAKSYENILLQHKLKITQYLKYIFCRLKRLYPSYFFVLCLYFLFAEKTSISKPIGLNLMLFVPLNSLSIIKDVWYIPTVFWIGIILFGLIVFLKHTSKFIIFPITLSYALYFLWNHLLYFKLPYISINQEIITSGVIRGIIGLIIGIYVYWFCAFLSKDKYKIKSKILSICLFVLEVVCVCNILYFLIIKSSFDKSTFGIYLYVSFIISLLYFKKEKILKFLSWKIWYPFAKISYMLYLTHMLLITILKVKQIEKIGGPYLYVLIIILSIIFAFICNFFLEFIIVKSKILIKQIYILVKNSYLKIKISS